MRQHRFRPGSFPCRVDRHGKRATGKIQQLRYVSDVDAQAAKWGLENHAPDVGRSAEPETVIVLDRFSASSRGPQTGLCEVAGGWSANKKLTIRSDDFWFCPSSAHNPVTSRGMIAPR